MISECGKGEATLKRVTRDIHLDQARDLLERVPRACLAYACDDGPLAQPVELKWQAERYFVGVPEKARQQPVAGQEAVLLVDEGVYFFTLRAIYIRGAVQPAETPKDAPAGHIWFELFPLKTVAWDYGMLREVDDAG
jgi:hypothetical protein